MQSNKKNRRQFLKNISLASLSLGIIPNISKANSIAKTADKSLLLCDKTTLDYYGQGPFYTPNPPVMSENQLAGDNESGSRLILSGRVFNLDCSQYIPDTVIDVWHANDAGQYDNSGYNLRGTCTSNSEGFYIFETIKPGKYLNGNQFRPSHIHFRIAPPGFFELIVTQLYFEGDTSIANDAAASITEGVYDASQRIIPLTTNSNGDLEGTWDIILNGDGVDGVSNVHLDKGVIYSVGPNPFSNDVIIKYGVFQRAKVSLMVYDIQGQLVATLEEKELPPEKYEAVWTPDVGLPNGHYFIALKINDLQVNYLKVIRG